MIIVRANDVVPYPIDMFVHVGMRRRCGSLDDVDEDVDDVALAHTTISIHAITEAIGLACSIHPVEHVHMLCVFFIPIRLYNAGVFTSVGDFPHESLDSLDK